MESFALRPTSVQTFAFAFCWSLSETEPAIALFSRTASVRSIAPSRFTSPYRVASGQFGCVPVVLVVVVVALVVEVVVLLVVAVVREVVVVALVVEVVVTELLLPV